MDAEPWDHPRQLQGAPPTFGRWSVDRRGLWVAALLLVLFVLWTVIVRVGITEGSRDSAWIVRPFGTWPETVDHVEGTSDIQFSLFATYDGGRATTRPEESVTPMVGRPTIGSVIDSFDSHNINGSRFVTGTQAGPVTSLSIYVAAPIDRAPNNQFEVAIYDDENGAPHRRLVVSDPGTLRADAWNTVAIDASLQPGTPYWFFYNTNGTTGAVNNAVYSTMPAAPLDEAIRSIRSTKRLGTADLVSFVGGQLPATLMLVVLTAFVARHRWIPAFVYLAGFALSLMMALAVRTLVFDPFGSYPSGHAMRAAYVLIIAAAFARRRAVDVAGGLVLAIIVFATIYNHGHYAEESLGGLLLAGAAAAIALSVAPMPTRSPSPTARSSAVHAATNSRWHRVRNRSGSRRNDVSP